MSEYLQEDLTEHLHENLMKSREILERLKNQPEYLYASKRIHESTKDIDRLEFDQNFYEEESKNKSFIHEYDVKKSEGFLQEVREVENVYKQYLNTVDPKKVQQEIQYEKDHTSRLSYYEAYQQAYDIKEKTKNQGNNELYESIDGNLLGVPSQGHLFLDTDKRVATFTKKDGGTYFIPYKDGFRTTLTLMKEGVTPKKVEYNPHTVAGGSQTSCAVCNRPLKNLLAQHIGVGSSCLKKVK